MAGIRGMSKIARRGIVAGVVVVLLVAGGYNIAQSARLDRDMVAAVNRNDTANALFYLGNGANPNARIDLKQPFSVGLALSDWLRRIIGIRPANPPPTALGMAVENENSALTRDLLLRGADVNARMENEQFPLLIETLRGDTEFTQMMLDRGAKVDARGQDGTTALWSAAFHGRLEIARMLLERGANPNASGSDGTTPLMAAADGLKENLPMIDLLIANGAKVNARSKKNQTALSLARSQRYTHIIERLRQAGATR